MVKFEQEARRVCAELFGSPVIRSKSPGRSVQVVRLILEDGRSMIATRRKITDRANLEFHVLQKLHSRGAKVPQVLAFDGSLLFQEDLGKKRMSLILKKVNRVQGERLLHTGLISLADIHSRAMVAGLDRVVATLGEGDDWLRNLIDRPRLVGEFLGAPTPKLPVGRLINLLRIRQPRFVKWDARPPNAVLLADGTSGWIDWENCGRRNRLDDLAWYFGDQSIPDWPEVEERLLKHHVPAFADNMTLDRAHDYLATFGALHMCVRLSQVLNREKKRGKESWVSQNFDDKTTHRALISAQKLSIRAARWSGRSTLLGPLCVWLQELSARMEIADKAG